ncbi:MAG TPA: hypothetical protein VJY85_03520 [Candidatus Limnocylindria bacterium]|nr:hypothetical protein [Candidatus Limnocylindria bacterium]
MAEPRPGRPAPLILVVEPPAALPGDPSYGALAARGQTLLAAELSRRFAAVGAEVQRLPARADTAGFHWGAWFASAARIARLEARTAGKPGEAIGYAGAGALALLDDRGLADLAAARPGEVVANNRFSADAFVVSGDVDGALNLLADCATDNAAVRQLESAGFVSRDLSAERWSRFDVDTPLDLALLRLATRLPGTRVLDGVVAAFLENATGPSGRPLAVPELDRIGAVVRDRDAELVVAGRVPSTAWAYLESESACRVRCFIEERGMRSAREHAPRSMLAGWVERLGAADLIAQLASLGDAVILDTRVLMAGLAGSAEASAWPPEEERFASDFLEADAIRTAWLAELTSAASEASVPFLLGGHALVSDGLHIVVDAAWLGR